MRKIFENPGELRLKLKGGSFAFPRTGITVAASQMLRKKLKQEEQVLLEGTMPHTKISAIKWKERILQSMERSLLST